MTKAQGDGNKKSVKSRSYRGTLITVSAFGGQNFLRLISNLILTRILFPEAFGLMALVMVFIIGLQMFSDTGIRQSIIQNERGDDPDFLNTAWTLQIIRGGILWVFAAVIAFPAASFYDQPDLIYLLPVAALGTVVQGFRPTREASHARELKLGRITALDLAGQVIGVICMVLLAFWLKSVWALVIGNLLGTIAKVIMEFAFLPGLKNRLMIEREAFKEMFTFGRYIFLSTAATFVTTQGDKAVLAAFVTTAELGVYNIGYFLGAVPFLISNAMWGKVIFPLYRLKPIQNSNENRRAVFRARRAVLAGSFALTVPLALGGVWLVELLYDERYQLGGAVCVMISLISILLIINRGGGGVLLAVKDTKSFFKMNAARSIAQAILMYFGAKWYGMLGVIIAPALATMLVYPYRAKMLAKYNGHDALGDFCMFLAFCALAGLAVWMHWTEILQLLPAQSVEANG